MFYMSYLTMSSFRADSMGLHAKIQKGEKKVSSMSQVIFSWAGQVVIYI